ncbi:20254_t:CDS:2, partial [Gigaspora rosea]
IDREKIQNRRNGIKHGTPFTNEVEPSEENVEEDKSPIFKHPIDKDEDLTPDDEYKEGKVEQPISEKEEQTSDEENICEEERPTLEGKGYPEEGKLIPEEEEGKFIPEDEEEKLLPKEEFPIYKEENPIPEEECPI